MAMASRNAWIDAWENDLTPSAAARRSAARVQARTSATRYYGREATARLPQPVPEAPRRTKPLTEVKVSTERRPRWRMVLVTMAMAALLLAAAVVCPVLINSAATDVEAAVGRMETQQRDLTEMGTALSAQVSALASPGRVAKEANKLGLQPATSVEYLSIDAGTVTEGDIAVAGR